MYDYREAVKDDVLEYIKDEINFEDFDTLDELEEKLNEDLWTEDSVTGRYTAFYIPVVEVDRFTGKAPTAETLGTAKQYDYRYIGGSNNE
jgi:hypothetical protein